MSNFQFFSLPVKKNLFGLVQKTPGSKEGQPLINWGSKVSSGRVAGQKNLTWVRSIFVARVESDQPFMVWIWVRKISPKNVKFFNFYPSGKKIPGLKEDRPLIN